MHLHVEDQLDDIPNIDERKLIDSIEGYVPFSEVDVTTSTCVVYFTSECVIPLEVYHNIDIVQDDSIYLKKEGNKKVIVGIASPGSILSAKMKGDQYPSRGLDKNKGFSTAVTLDMSLEDKNVNIFLFKGSFKITGVKCKEHPISVFRYISVHLKYMKSIGYNVCTELPSISSIKWGMIQLQFCLSPHNNLMEVNNRLKGIGGFLSRYIPTVNNDYMEVRFPSPYKKKNSDRKYRLFKCYKDFKVSFTAFGWEESYKLYKWLWLVYHTVSSHS